MGNKTQPSRRKGCDVAVDTSDPALPVAGRGALSRVRASRNAPRRALALIALHAVIAAHITHFWIRGATLSPVEPSESMYTLELGQLNAGFVFFGVSLLLTAVFGRFVCGWGCHIVALQDFCGWIMKKLGIRPRAFRSRFLGFAPLILALYMFVWPSVRRLWTGAEFPGLSNHFVTTDFWVTFPGPLYAVLTFLTCGFAAVYVLGAKGFCTYGCPYGAFFGFADTLAPGRIVVSDNCEQCGHCTATCTSNVRVHEEVRTFGQVVDPGCMKCMDCVSVCPKGALSFGFVRPRWMRRRAVAPPRAARHYDLTLGEEAFCAAVFAGGTLAFRGLYDGPPLLMSVALGGMTAFVAMKLMHLVRRPSVRLNNLMLKLGGRIALAGRLFALVAIAWCVFAVHSGFVQWHRARGAAHLARTEAVYAEVLDGTFAQRSYGPGHRPAVENSLRHFAIADRWGLAGVLEVKRGLAWGHLLRGELEQAMGRLTEALALGPDQPRLHEDIVELLAARGRFGAAADALRGKIAAVEATGEDHCRLGGYLAQAERLAEASDAYRECVEQAPAVAATRYNYGGVLRRIGRYPEAIEQLGRAAELEPTDPDARVELGLALSAVGRNEDAVRELERAIELAPSRPESTLYLPGLIRQLRGGSDGP